jgi:ATP-dependent phosphofructokinase / diphosphate-dependent phosphofructokinase
VYLAESKTMVTQAFYDYALPLIGEPLPQHIQLETLHVQ